MKLPNEIPAIAQVLAWLAWAARMLGAMAGAADSYTPPRTEVLK